MPTTGPVRSSSSPSGTAIVGPVAAIIGIHAVFIVGTTLLILGVAVILLIPSVRQIRADTGGVVTGPLR